MEQNAVNNFKQEMKNHKIKSFSAHKSKDGSSTTFNVDNFFLTKTNFPSLISKIKSSYPESSVNEFGMCFSKLHEKYLLHYEVDFFTDDGSCNIKIFASASKQDSVEEIKSLSNTLANEFDVLSNMVNSSKFDK